MQRPRSPEPLRQAPPAGLRHGRYATWQHRASAWAGSGCVHGMVRTRVSSGPLPGLNQGLGILLLGISGPYWEWSGPLLRGPGPVPGVWIALVEVLNPARKSGLCIQGSSPFLWGSGPTVATLEYIVFPGHAVALEPSTPGVRCLFATRLKIAVWTSHLHTIVTGTPFPGYRHPSPYTFFENIIH